MRSPAYPWLAARALRRWLYSCGDSGMPSRRHKPAPKSKSKSKSISRFVSQAMSSGPHLRGAEQVNSAEAVSHRAFVKTASTDWAT